MKRWILEGPRKLKLADIPVLEPGRNEALIEIKMIGVCAADAEIYQGNRDPKVVDGLPTLGHEACGVVAEVGQGTGGLRKGDRVALKYVWGCFAEYVKGPIENIKPFPETISFLQGSILEVLPGILSAVERSDISAQTDVLIVGQGVSGLMLTQVARLYEPRRLITADLFDTKLELSRQFGSTHTLNVSKGDLIPKVKKIIPDGPDVIILAHVEGDGIGEAIELLRDRGKIILYGCLRPTTKSLNFFPLHEKRGDLLTTVCKTYKEVREKWDMAVRYVEEGLLNPEPIITQRFPLSQLEEALKLKDKPRGDVIHVMIEV